MAKLYFRYGTMGSTKTLSLLTTAYNFEEKNIPFMVLKPSIDTRDGENIIKSRIGIERECVVIYPDVDIYEAVVQYNNILMAKLSKLEWILIDESQFLTENQIDQLAKIVDTLNINVMCYGLRTDFSSRLFSGSKRLFELSDDIEEIKSRCSCGKKTAINARFNENGEIVLNGSQIMVGGNDLYRPLCRKCWREFIKRQQNK
jgi:thymidine kinase